jgi:2-octaprenyl-6-methoxyphenol hydroxylase
MTIAIVGGGLTGAAAALVAARAGRDVLHFSPPAPPDRRTSALMLPSLDFLREAGVLEDPAELGTPLRKIRIIDATSRLVRSGESLFEAAEFGFDAFGYNIANTTLLARLAERAAGFPNLRTIAAPVAKFARTDSGFALEAGGEAFSASLIVGADGRQSAVRAFAGIEVRIHRYEQAALVADLTLERPLDECSVEFHYENGPFTLVPAGGNRANLVWIDRRELFDAARDPASLASAILTRSARLFGDVAVTAGPHVFDLVSLAARAVASPGIVLVGEAAHAFPPIGAQGLNIGLRDVAALAALFAYHQDSRALTTSYAEARRADISRTSLMVDTLFRSLIADFLPADIGRSAGLLALRTLRPLRRAAFETGMGRR